MSISFEDLLRFYEIAGVDSPIDETPQNHFINSEFGVRKREKNAPIVVSTTAVPLEDTISLALPNIAYNQSINKTQSKPENAQTLEELRTLVEAYDGCSLKFTAKNTCFSDGVAGSALMLIGEAPGRDEDIQGLPFVGRSGQLLNKMLAAIGLSRTNVYIANTIPWRPPGNRTPTPTEIELCRPFIERQIELASPKILLALGGPAAHALTGLQQGILRLRGHWSVHKTPNGMEIPVMPTLHPAYLLRMPGQKKLAWLDLLAVSAKLKERDTKN